MLKAFERRKTRGLSISKRDLLSAEFYGSEDLLTSTVFERLNYLNEASLADLLRKYLSASNNHGHSFNGIPSFEFWPRFNFDGARVEPDVVLYFDNAIIVVEVKRWDDSSLQLPEQLYRQWCAVRADNRTGMREIIQWALGGHRECGNANAWLDIAKALRINPDQQIIASSWIDFYRITTEFISNARNDSRVLIDIIAALRLHGILPRVETEFNSLRPIGISHAIFSPYPDDTLSY